VKAGDVVKVKVLEVDVPRKRIALTMRMGDEPTQGKRPDSAPANRGGQQRPQPRSSSPAPSGNAMAAAFAKLRK
jgi:uncharacterized protein